MTFTQTLTIICLLYFQTVDGKGLSYERKCIVLTDQFVFNVTCDVESGESWSQEEFGEWIKGGNFNLDIRCQDGAEVILKRPIRIVGLRGLQISNCYIKDYFNIEIPVGRIVTEIKLRYLTFIDCTLEFKWSAYVKYRINYTEKLLKVDRCPIPNSLHKCVFHKVGIKEVEAHKNASVEEKYRLKLLSTRCVYTNLKYLRISSSEDLAPVIVDRLMENGIFPSLEILSLENNRFVLVPTNLFTDLWYKITPKLKFVNLSENSVQSLSFLHPPADRERISVDLTGNRINEIDVNDLERFLPSVVDLRKNPLLCTCNHQFYEKLNNFESRSHIYRYLQNETCFSEISDSSISLSEVSVKDLCDQTIATTQKPTFFYRYETHLNIIFFVISVSICVACIIHKFKSRILQIYRIKTTRNCHCQEQPKNYDAFISYSSLDERWVYDVLCTKLQSETPDVKLCLHHKDFIPGACIADNIIHSVENSRFTFLILSSNFISSEWCHMEFQKAFHQTLKHRHHLLVLLIEDVDFSLLNCDLRFFLQTYTYLKYADSLFWQKLMKIVKRKTDDRRCYSIS